VSCFREKADTDKQVLTIQEETTEKVEEIQDEYDLEEEEEKEEQLYQIIKDLEVENKRVKKQHAHKTIIEKNRFVTTNNSVNKYTKNQKNISSKKPLEPYNPNNYRNR
jgi:hypothetical protein